MAYDAYYADQYDYNQDPYAGYGYDAYGSDTYGYDGYGYDAYGYGYEQFVPSPLPDPDKNWVDPVKVNKEYLKKIQKGCIHKGFEGLKENCLFLLEVLVRSVTVRKEIFQIAGSADENQRAFIVFVKCLDLSFAEVEGTQSTYRRSIGDTKTGSVLYNRVSFENLFQSIYTSPGRQDSLIPEVEGEVEDGKPNDETESRDKEAVPESPGDKNQVAEDDPSQEFENIKIMKGKSFLQPMSGLAMIQKLQQYPLAMKMVRCEFTEEGERVEGEILATSGTRFPETFRQAVLMSSEPDTILPVIAVTTNLYKLVDPLGYEVGDTELTLVLTCLGKGAVNCISEFKDNHDYEHPFLLRTLKAKRRAGDQNYNSAVNPKLAEEILKMGLFLPSRKTSSEILQHCMSSNLISTDDEERRHALKSRDCGWFSMVKMVRPPSIVSFDPEQYMMELEMEKASLWRKHKNICRDFNVDERPPEVSFEERLREVRMPIVQTGVTGVEVQNPFEKEAKPSSVSMLSLKSFVSTESPHGNFKPPKTKTL